MLQQSPHCLKHSLFSCVKNISVVEVNKKKDIAIFIKIRWLVSLVEERYLYKIPFSTYFSDPVSLIKTKFVLVNLLTDLDGDIVFYTKISGT